MARIPLVAIGTMAFFHAISPAPAGADTSRVGNVEITCRAPKGMVRWEKPDQWFPDGIKDGWIRLGVRDGKPKVIVMDVRGVEYDAEKDGAKVIVTYVNAEGFGLAVIHPDDGIVETYNIYANKDKAVKLQWTANRSNAVQEARVGAYFADCD